MDDGARRIDRPLFDLTTILSFIGLPAPQDGKVGARRGKRPGWRLRLRWAALGFAVGVLGASYYYLVNCGFVFAQLPPREVIRWTDPSTGTHFTVRSRPVFLEEGEWVWFAVTTEDTERVANLSYGDFVLTRVRLVRDGDWLLVVNANFVVGGYNYSKNFAYGDGDWDKLPYTLHATAGTVVAEAVERTDGSEYSRLCPLGLPMVAEGERDTRSVPRVNTRQSAQ